MRNPIEQFKGASNEIERLSVVEDSAVSNESHAVSLLENPPFAKRRCAAGNCTITKVTRAAAFPRNDGYPQTCEALYPYASSSARNDHAPATG
jgi:hypothetical protein